MTPALTFEPVTFDVVDRDGERWLTMADIVRALYGIPKGGGQSGGPFENAERAMKRLYARHADEFTPAMTALAELHTAGGVQRVRIFSLRGTYMLAMFARTERAKAFRRWVLDVLEAQTRIPAGALERLQAAEHAEAQSFEAARRGSLAMHRRKREKPRLVIELEQARDAAQLRLTLEGGEQ